MRTRSHYFLALLDGDNDGSTFLVTLGSVSIVTRTPGNGSSCTLEVSN